MPAQVTSSAESSAPSGLRARKKLRTRAAIQTAALELFEEQGYEATTVEQIAERAEVANATFFRYFPSKAEVLVADNNEQLPAIVQAILARPAHEGDLTAVCQAILEEWVAVVDPELTARKARIVAASDLLQGLSYHRGEMWLADFVDALVARNGAPPDDARCILKARFALEAVASAVEGWIGRGCVDDLADAVQSSFDLTVEVCAELAEPR